MISPISTAFASRFWVAPPSFVLATAALPFLVLGAAVYVFARPIAPWFLPAALHWPLATSGALAVAGGMVPTFAHTAAFSLFTASALGGTLRHTLAACGVWTATNVLFEIGQHESVSVWLAAKLPSWLDHVWLLDRTRSYFLEGSFDFYDIAAAVAGGLFAAVVIVATRHRGERP